MPDPITFVVSVEKADSLASLTEKALMTNHAEAEVLARELVDIMQILHGPDHLEVGVALFYLAIALEEQGRLPEALSMRQRARTILLGQGLWRN